MSKDIAMDNNQRRMLEDATLEAMMSLKTKHSDKEFLFVCPMVRQVVAANRSIDVLIKAEETACLGLICRQIFEILVSIEYMFSIFHLKQDLFRDFCKYFFEHGRIGEYNEKKKRWMKARMSLLCENYAKNSNNEMVTECYATLCYATLCNMTHFSAVHTCEALCIEGDTLKVDLSGKSEDANKVCQSADFVRNELTRLIIGVIRREYLHDNLNR